MPLDRDGQLDEVAAVPRLPLDVGETVLRSWMAALQEKGPDAFPGNGRLPAVEEELRRLRAENKRLLAEREILKKAAAFFAREVT